MKKSFTPIRGPIGQGTPFKQVYNSDGSPNYVLAVQNQMQASKQIAPKQISNNNIIDKGKEYETRFVSGLKESIAKLQKEMEQKPHLFNADKEHQKTPSISQNKEKTISRNEPAIDR